MTAAKKKPRKPKPEVSAGPAPEMSMDLAELVKTCMAAKELGKVGYSESDRLANFVRKRVKPGKVIEYTIEVEGKPVVKRAKIVNNHAAGKSHFHGSFCRPYELVEV